MLFAIVARDRADAGTLRADTRPQHLIWLQEKGAQVRLAGPLLDSAAESAQGSLLILDFPDLASAQAEMANDPYAKAGLFETVEIHAFRQVFPTSP